jgi:hypothetical protein
MVRQVLPGVVMEFRVDLLFLNGLGHKHRFQKASRSRPKYVTRRVFTFFKGSSTEKNINF